MCYLKTFDPTVPMAYFVCVMSICVFTANPYLQLCALFGGVVLLLCIKKTKALKLLALSFAVIVIMGVTNPIFVQRGLTELFYIGKDPYTLEALLYGLSLGCSIASLLIWFSVFNAIVSQDDILAVFGKKLPKTALVISMILGFIPKLRRQYTRLLHAQYGTGGTRRKSLRRCAVLFIACLAYEAERVMDISMSMKARGYGLKNRTHAQSRHMRKSDAAAIAFSLVLCIVCYVCIGTGKLDYWYYPRLSPNGFDPVGVGCYFLLCISPVFFIVKERTLWRYCPAKT